jgi:hypothetical protein
MMATFGQNRSVRIHPQMWNLSVRGRFECSNQSVRGNVMKKILTVLVAVAAIGMAALATSSTAEARWGWGGGWGWRGGGWGWGGPFVAGAIVGGALAASPYYGGYYGYYPYRAYPYYYGCRRVWNGWAWVSSCY